MTTVLAVSPRLERRSPAAVLLIGGIRLYRLVFSSRPSPCRFDPTCSAFGLEAIAVHGAVRGGWLTLRRIGRCRPGGGQGYDPVPARRDGGSAELTSAVSDPSTANPDLSTGPIVHRPTHTD